ncbi:MAG: acetylglutamate kinase [Aliidiomarina sp.]|uniref:acetylglutamate kinase n=1 Tax=Aliidiomarina sp. TaxID=1872439 RepID=UPI0025C085BF|nr:acetylglutamate kinase [Aliidiomarina sp.]MCH8500310.1 acetylglutamate kinase [Aliidiomarina sp.]
MLSSSKAVKVIKVGGAILENQTALANFLAAVKASGELVVIVHGGGNAVDQQLHQAGLSSTKIDGQRVTSAEQIDLIVGALAGTTNKALVAAAQKAGISAVGLSLADGPLCGLEPVPSLGLVGEPKTEATENTTGEALIHCLLTQGFCPVISSIGIDDQFQLRNVNADYAAAAIAMLLQAELFLFSDVPAILDLQQNPINELSLVEARVLLTEPFIKGGMQVKLKAAILAAERSRRSTAIAGWADAQTVIALLRGERLGTHIRV